MWHVVIYLWEISDASGCWSGLQYQKPVALKEYSYRYDFSGCTRPNGALTHDELCCLHFMSSVSSWVKCPCLADFQLLTEGLESGCTVFVRGVLFLWLTCVVQTS